MMATAMAEVIWFFSIWFFFKAVVFVMLWRKRKWTPEKWPLERTWKSIMYCNSLYQSIVSPPQFRLLSLVSVVCFLFSFLVVKIKKISRMAKAKDCSYVVWAPQSVFVDPRQPSKHRGCSDTKSGTVVKTQHLPFNSVIPPTFLLWWF